MPSMSNTATRPPSSRSAQMQADAPCLRSAIILPPPPAIAPPDYVAAASGGLRDSHYSHLGAKSNGPSEKHADLSSESITKEYTPSCPPWTVHDIPNVPANFPIERTHAILTDTSPSVIAGRVAACLRDRSVDAVYDGGNALCLAETADFTKFYVRLFKCEYDNHSNGVLVEVQRRCGGCVTFHEESRAVLRAAKGLPPEVISNVSRPALSESFLAQAREFECTSKLCDRNKKAPTIQTDTCSCARTKKKEETLAALEVADCLLHRDRLDANLLGMESLVYLTDAKASGTETATLVANAILMDGGEDEYEQGLDIKAAVVSLIRFRNLSGNNSNDDGDRDGSNVGIRLNGIMHNHALAVLANSIALLTDEDEWKASEILTDFCGDELVTALTEEIRNAESRPNDANLAARCINGLKLLLRATSSSREQSSSARVSFPLLVKGLISSDCL